ncbi:hypothetical protein ACFLYM_02795 [Chloroflexota bacterium]
MKRIAIIMACVLFMAQGCITIVRDSGPAQDEVISKLGDPQPTEAWEQLSPGMSTKEDVISKLGEPQTVEISEDGEILGYPTQNESMPNYVVMKGGVVQYTTMILPADERECLAEIVQKYGEPEKITYSSFSHETKTYVYATQGITLIVNKNAGKIYEKKCYTPMSLDEYMRTLGKNLPLKNPYIR